MARALNRDKLLGAFDEIGRAAARAGTRLNIAVYGGSALMLASNFRFSTEDVDVSKLEEPWPEWLRRVVDKLAAENGWQSDWSMTAWHFI
jgi:predicted proteasome-type protease